MKNIKFKIECENIDELTEKVSLLNSQLRETAELLGSLAAYSVSGLGVSECNPNLLHLTCPESSQNP